MNFATEFTDLQNVEIMPEATFIIAENNDLCRLGLERIIHDQIQLPIIHHAINKLELHKALLTDSEAVVIINFESIDVDNLDQITILSVCFPQSNWLFVGEIPDETFLMPLTASFGRANFVLKSNDYDVIALAILNTVAGKKYFCSEALQIIIDGHNRKKENSVKRNLLTTTELELVQLFTQGKTAKEIAELRCLSHHTINTHRKNIFRKLELNNVQELIKFALKNGLVDLTEYYI
ncbi:MAG: response regulator transcription factor [Paludibacter sp.]